jgi:hypothetical protein
MRTRLLLILNGIVAIRTEPLDEMERARRIQDWTRVFGPRPDIREQAA